MASQASRDGRFLSVEVTSGPALDVRAFTVEARMNALFEARLRVVSDNPAIDFDLVVGQPARFSLQGPHASKTFTGIVSEMHQIRAEESGLSTYELTIVPVLWLASQKRNHRMFQQMTEPDIALQILSEWGEVPIQRFDRAAYKKRKYRVQYGESDLAFLTRMLEEAGVSFFFTEQDGRTTAVLADAPETAEPDGRALAFIDSPNPGIAPAPYVTGLRVGRRIRPGRYTMRDVDYRLAPTYPLVATAASPALRAEERLERFHYTPGAFLYGSDRGDSTPAADDKGKTRTDEREGALLAKKRLDAQRSSARVLTFATNKHDLSPGAVILVAGHPHPLLAEGRSLLVVSSRLEGTAGGEWTHSCDARPTDMPYRPPLSIPRPKTNGVESGTVVGPPGEEIHTDEMGRVRVHFHWDRQSRMNDNSSCWIPVSHPWGGAGYGGINLPRVGQEVLVDFLGGDPDRPIVVGRVYTNLQKVPYGLPANKTRSAWKSNSTQATGGYNEILFEDAAGREVVYEQAEKNRRRLVKNDETITVGADREKLVKGNEVETTRLDRTEVTDANRTEITGVDRTTTIGGNRYTSVHGDDVERTGGRLLHTVLGDADILVNGARRTEVDGSEHRSVGGGRVERVGGSTSLIVGGESHEKVYGRKALEVVEDLDIRVKTKLVIEVDEDITLKGPGGFIRITSEGITIRGTVVKVNSGGSPAEGQEVSPSTPALPEPALFPEPTPPEPDDVARTWLGPDAEPRS